MPQRVLFLGEYGWRNGGENSFLAIAPALSSQGFEFVTAVPSASEFSTALRTLDFATIDLQLFDQGHRKTQSRIREDLNRLIQRTRPDLIHCNSLSTSRLIGPVARSCQVPSIGYLRDILKLSGQAIRDISQINQLVAVSKATRDYHVSAGLPANQIDVIYNGVDGNRFKARPATGEIHTKLGMPESAQIALCIGQIGIRKGVDIVLESFLKLANTNESLHMVFAGSRHSQKQESIDYESQLKSTGCNSPFANRIHWLGRVEEIPRLMNEATLLLHGARQEPLGRVLLEAAASGLPFIATDVGGTPEIIAGLEINLVPPDNILEMAIAAQRLIQSPSQREKEARDLRAQAVHRFSVQKCANAIGELYRRQLDG